MRRGPLAPISRMFSSIIGSPPMPEPTITPVRSAFDSSIARPASSSASFVAAMPKWMKVSERRASLGGIHCVASKPFTSAAMRVDEQRGVELRDRADAAPAVDEVVPGLGDADADGGDDARGR